MEVHRLHPVCVRVNAVLPLILSAGERRSFTANTIIRNPEWRKKDRTGALRMHPDDAERAGVADGGRGATGVSPNALTRIADRDRVAGTPWHKHTPARVEAM